MSSFDFSEYPLVIVSWYQEGCPACEEFVPRLRAIAERYKACISTAILNANQYTEDADALFVRATPTTMILRYGRKSPYQIGAVEDAEIEALYATVLRGLALGGEACEIGDG
jgi:thioredoxin-like negative regulator of GroEL